MYFYVAFEETSEFKESCSELVWLSTGGRDFRFPNLLAATEVGVFLPINMSCKALVTADH